MTDKQIIDEERMFECVWCKYDFKESDAHLILSENLNECVCSDCITEWADNLLYDFKSKEQECKKWKKYGSFYLNKFIQLKQTLTEIKEIAEEAKEDICNNCGWRNTDSCDPEDYTCGEFIKILQKISEVEDEFKRIKR